MPIFTKCFKSQNLATISTHDLIVGFAHARSAKVCRKVFNSSSMLLPVLNMAVSATNGPLSSIIIIFFFTCKLHRHLLVLPKGHFTGNKGL